MTRKDLETYREQMRLYEEACCQDCGLKKIIHTLADRIKELQKALGGE